MSWLRDLHGDHIVRIESPQVYRLLWCFIISILPQFGNVPIWLITATAFLIAWRFYLEKSGEPLPSNLTKLLLGFVLFLAVSVDKGTLAGKEPGTALMVGLISIKFLELRGRRDYMVLTFVLYFMCMTALLFEQTVAVFAYVFVACCVLTINLIALYLSLPGDRTLRQPITFAVRLLAQSVPLALVLFIFFPRLDVPLGFNLGGESTGLPPDIQAGSFTELVEDGGMVFRADFPDGQMPGINSLYWRAFVLWNYDAAANKWKDFTYPDNKGKEGNSGQLVGGKTVTQNITLHPTGQHWLFALDYPVKEAWNRRASLTPGHVLWMKDELRRKIQYTITSQVGSYPQPGTSGEMELLCLRISGADEINPEVVELAASFRTPHATNREVVQNALEYYRRNRFEYTTHGINYGPDPLHEFLFRKRRGFCEHFASSFAVLMRLARVPARVVAGYHGGEYNPYGNFIIVRHLNAHAWCEVYLHDVGWMRVDPTTLAVPVDTPQIAQGNQNSGDSSGEASLLRRLGPRWTPYWVRRAILETRYRWQLVEETWDHWVLSYNPDSQLDFLEKYGLQKFQWELFTVTATLALAATLYLVTRSLRRKRSPDERLQAIYREFCQAVENAGVTRRAWEGPIQYTARAAQILPKASGPIRKFGREYAFLRYGRIDHLVPALGPLRERVGQVKETLAQMELN